MSATESFLLLPQGEGRGEGLFWSGRAEGLNTQIQPVVNTVFEQALDVAAFFRPFDNRPALLLGCANAYGQVNVYCFHKPLFIRPSQDRCPGQQNPPSFSAASCPACSSDLCHTWAYGLRGSSMSFSSPVCLLISVFLPTVAGIPSPENAPSLAGLPKICRSIGYH